MMTLRNYMIMGWSPAKAAKAAKGEGLILIKLVAPRGCTLCAALRRAAPLRALIWSGEGEGVQIRAEWCPSARR